MVSIAWLLIVVVAALLLFDRCDVDVDVAVAVDKVELDAVCTDDAAADEPK